MRGRTRAEAEAITARQGATPPRRRGSRRTRPSPAAGRRSTLLYAQARPAHARAADRALRAQGVRRGGDLGHQSVRPVGRRTRQGTRLAPRADRRRRRRRPRARSIASTAGLIAHMRALRDADRRARRASADPPRRLFQPFARRRVDQRRAVWRASRRDRRRARRSRRASCSFLFDQPPVDRRERDRLEAEHRRSAPAILRSRTTTRFSMRMPNRPAA